MTDDSVTQTVIWEIRHEGYRADSAAVVVLLLVLLFSGSAHAQSAQMDARAYFKEMQSNNGLNPLMELACFTDSSDPGVRDIFTLIEITKHFPQIIEQNNLNFTREQKRTFAKNDFLVMERFKAGVGSGPAFAESRTATVTK